MERKERYLRKNIYKPDEKKWNETKKERRYLGKMFGIYANFSLGTQKIFYGALTHYMSYYYFKGYAYTCIEWHVGVFLYFHRLPKFLDTHDTLRISRMNIS